MAEEKALVANSLHDQTFGFVTFAISQSSNLAPGSKRPFLNDVRHYHWPQMIKKSLLVSANPVASVAI
jgi:hypothetical protein